MATVDRQGHALQACLIGLQAVTQNEAVTRARMDALDARLDALEVWQSGGFWDRLRYLLTGRLAPVSADPPTETWTPEPVQITDRMVQDATDAA